VAQGSSDIVDLTTEMQLQSIANRKAKAVAAADKEATNKKPMAFPHSAGSASVAKILVQSYRYSQKALYLELKWCSMCT
jgi:hypothetical protein